MRRLPFRTLLWLALPVALTGCANRPPAPPVLIGHVANLSGPDKEAAEQAARGIRLAVKDVERDAARGLGRPVAVLHTDTQGRLAAFEAEAVRLVAVNRVVALLGGTTAAEVERLDRDRVPVVSLAGLRPRSASDLVFCTGLAPSLQGRLLARFAVKQMKQPASTGAATGAVGSGASPLTGPLPAAAALALAGPSVVVLEDDRQEEHGVVADSFLKELPERGQKAQPAVSPPRPVRIRYGKDADFAKLGRQVAEEGPAVLLVAGDAAAVRGLRGELPETTGLLFGGSELELSGLRNAPPGRGPLYAVTSFVTDRPAAEEFVRQYRAACGEEPDAAAAVAYEAAGLLLSALRHADGFYAPARLVEQLNQANYQGIFGKLTFDGRVLRRPSFLVSLDGGRLATVEPYEPGRALIHEPPGSGIRAGSVSDGRN